MGLGTVASDVVVLKYATDNRAGAFMSELVDPRSGHSRAIITIVRGDVICEKYNVDLIKIDVEGRELDVLASLTKTIQGTQPVVELS